MYNTQSTRILITGKSSYIGTSFEKWLQQWPDDYTVDTLDMIGDGWRNTSFSGYDVVFHVAGIAHVSTDPKLESLYWQVNRDLAIETAKKAKAEGVKQFIFMSSIIVYGSDGKIGQKKIITKDTIPQPENFYGRTKLEADLAIEHMADESFHTVIVRTPVVYGPGCKGNFPKLIKLAKLCLVFPNIENERSMIYIDNLCEYIKLCIDTQKSGVCFPQNSDYVSTKDIISVARECLGKKTKLVGIFNPLLRFLSEQCGYINKVFGNKVYDKALSSDFHQQYNVTGFEQSIQHSIDYNREIDCEKRVLILVNHDVVIYNFRRELVEELIRQKYKVYISSPFGERIELLKAMGCEYIPANVDRRSINPFADLKLLSYYIRLIQQIKPKVVLSYTIKPNIWGGIAARITKTPCLNNITGLGSTFLKENLLCKLLIGLYKIALTKSQCVFFQNEENQELFVGKNVVQINHKLIPGSGVNLEHYRLLDYPSDETVHFLFIARVMKEKGIDQYLEAAESIRKKYPNTVFHILGFCEEAYEERLKELEQRGIIQYHGMQSDVRKFHEISHCTIHPTYYPEGMSNVLLESAACGRPVITTNRSGCREIVEEGVTGYLVEEKNSEDLIAKIETFLRLDYASKKQMGLAGRKKVEKEFDRHIVINAYIEEIRKVFAEENG